jgi:uncharacterized protein (DUF1778 family)
MAKKLQKKAPTRFTLHVRCKEEDQETFRLAAEKEGFNSVTAWVLWNLRRVAKQTLADADQE